MVIKKLRSKTDGSTLIEVIVAMVIIIVIFGIAMVIFSDVFRIAPSMRRQLVHQFVSDELEKTGHWGNLPADSTFTRGNFQISRRVSVYPGSAQLYIIEIKVFDNAGNALETGKKVISNEK